MAKVTPVMPRSEMSFYVKSLIWWQRNDYDDFKKTGRMIAKAMLCGGSEIWLQTSNAWGKKQGNNKNKNSNNNNGSFNNNNNNGNNSEHFKALQKYGVTPENSSNSSDDDDEAKDDDIDRSKWWCKFGHSRRGLEHIVSIEEGRMRQKFVNTAVKAVLEEQRRQRLTRRDTKKIALVSMQYTSWARDLAIAAGAADAEAVTTNFCSQAKCRMHHLSTALIGKGSVLENGGVSANFVMSANPTLTAKILDANAHRKLPPSDDEEKRRTHINMMARKAAGFGG
mmetsp:Transcript_7063/g.8947  ORF Transcript_7063/g.8947 Transcript_7063/m.8947 type:complete len:281 (-) Transcript_7063:165-1007(-)